MTPKPTEPTIEPELTLDQELRFNILVPFYGAMERKRQEDAGKLTKQDASPIYTEAIKKIERIISDQVAKAKGCTSCGKRMCDNCERLWSTYEPKDQRPNQGTIKQGEQMILLAILIVLITQIGQVLLIVANQDTNPLVFIVPLDLLMLVGIFYIAERIK